MFSWVRNALGRRRTPARGNRSAQAHRSVKLVFERLEDRLVPAAAPALIAGSNINISQSSASEQENAIIINPTNPSNLFATSTGGAVAPGGVGYRFSMDAGATWQASNASALFTSAGDQQMAWDRFGNLFMVQLSFTGGNLVTTVGLSINGGASFSLLLNTGVFGDQPSIAVGPNSVWVDYNTGGPMTARGAPVTGLGVVGAFTAAGEPAGLPGTFGDIAVGPNGQVMMVYQEQNGTVGPAANGPSELYFSLDPDGTGPLGFSPTATIMTTKCGSYDAIPSQPNRTVGAEANLAWDRSNGIHHGRVYLVYSDENIDESNDLETMVRFSDNNGATWSTPVRVNDDALGNGKSQFNPAIAVDQTTGNIAVTWYDCRNSPTNNTAQVWGSVSHDGGVTWDANLQISGGSTNALVSAAAGFDFGDYDKMDFHAGVFYRAWTDNSNSTGNNPGGVNGSLDLYTAQVFVGLVAAADEGGIIRLYNPVRFRRHSRTRVYSGLMTSDELHRGHGPGAALRDLQETAARRQSAQRHPAYPGRPALPGDRPRPALQEGDPVQAAGQQPAPQAPSLVLPHQEPGFHDRGSLVIQHLQRPAILKRSPS